MLDYPSPRLQGMSGAGYDVVVASVNARSPVPSGVERQLDAEFFHLV